MHPSFMCTFPHCHDSMLDCGAFPTASRKQDRNLTFALDLPRTQKISELGITYLELRVQESMLCQSVMKNLMILKVPTIVYASSHKVAQIFAKDECYEEAIVTHSGSVGSPAGRKLMNFVGDEKSQQGSQVDVIQLREGGGASGNDTPQDAPSTSSTSWRDWARVIFASVFMGAFFGTAMESGTVTLPLVIREQFLLRRFIMLKVSARNTAS